MKLTVVVDMDNAAFIDGPNSGLELLKIFNAITQKIANGVQSGTPRDSNGNSVGHWVVSGGGK